MVEKGKSTTLIFECSKDRCGKKASTRQRQFIGNYFNFSNFASP